MTHDFVVKFYNIPPLYCKLNDTNLAKKYLSLIKQQWTVDPHAIFRDPQKYTIQYFEKLVHRAKQELGWDWQRDSYNVAVTTKLHKDIEAYLANGFENIPAEHDDILHELHFALHALESGSLRNSWLQIEWFNDTMFAIDPLEYPAKINLEFGDIRLQNPHVGHHPLYLYEQQDDTNVMQTCRFHDQVKPGINLVINTNTGTDNYFDWNSYINWFNTHAPEFVATHGIEKIKQFTGHPVVGRVVNTDDLLIAVQQPTLEFEYLEFDGAG